MATARFFVTYEIITSESAEDGETESRGYVQPGEWHTDDRGEPLTLREALDLCRPSEDCGTWFCETSPIENRDHFEKGEDEYRSLHPVAITPASYRRLRKLLKIQ